MPRPSRTRDDPGSTLSFWMLAGLLVVLWIAGGASRADVGGQVVVRFVAWALLVAYTLAGPRLPWRRVAPVAAFTLLSVALVALQLVPLPPGLWTALPGRGVFGELAAASGQVQPWRPVSLSPGATANALGALVVPVAVVVLMAGLSRRDHRRMLAFVLGLVMAGAVLGLLQFSGARVDNPLINDVAGMVSGNFANRNHFAVFLALGCLFACAWAFAPGSDGPAGQAGAMRPRGLADAGGWRVVALVGLLPFLLLMILATGSRMGTITGFVAIVAGAALVRRPAARLVAGRSRGVRLALGAGAVLVIAVMVGTSVLLGRAVSFDRALAFGVSEDLRARALPVVLGMIERYFPVGAGFGTFDPVYRIHEPDALLQPTYFNHAHNDWVEIALEGGLPAIVLVGAGLVWWLRASGRTIARAVRSPRAGRGADMLQARVGAVAILLLVLASAADYPLRTPMMMAMLVLAAGWLGRLATPADGERAPAG